MYLSCQLADAIANANANAAATATATALQQRLRMPITENHSLSGQFIRRPQVEVKVEVEKLLKCLQVTLRIVCDRFQKLRAQRQSALLLSGRESGSQAGPDSGPHQLFVWLRSQL